MRLVVATVLLALVSAATASADVKPVPVGFTPNAKLSAAESFVAGKAVVGYCATTQDVFGTADLAATGEDLGGAYSYVGGTQSFFAPWVCSALTKWQTSKSKKRASQEALKYLGASLLALAHESELLAGVSDESVADCKGLAKLPQTIARFYPLKKRATLHDVMGWAWSAHDSQPEQYLENCPQR